jgi:hypothetical protein
MIIAKANICHIVVQLCAAVLISIQCKTVSLGSILNICLVSLINSCRDVRCEWFNLADIWAMVLQKQKFVSDD